jgi:hypothetical protein
MPGRVTVRVNGTARQIYKQGFDMINVADMAREEAGAAKIDEVMNNGSLQLVLRYWLRHALTTPVPRNILIAMCNLYRPIPGRFLQLGDDNKAGLTLEDVINDGNRTAEELFCGLTNGDLYGSLGVPDESAD